MSVHDYLILELDNTSAYWVVDSGASCHATPHRKFFHDYVQGDFGHVLLGDDEPCKIVGKGKIRMDAKECNAHSCYENKFDLNRVVGR